MNSALAARLRNLFCRATTVLVNSGANLQRLQLRLFGDEAGDGIEFMEHYGLTSNPPAGLDAAVLFVGGSRDNGVCVAVGDRKFRIRGLKSGEVALYTDEGDYIKLLRDNHIHIKTKHLLADVENDAVLNCETAEVNASQKASIVSEVIELRGTSCISLMTPNLNIGGEGEGRTTTRIQGDMDQDGSHVSTGDQIAGGVSQISHPHRDAGGSGPSGPPIAG